MAGALPALDVKAWAPVPQGEGPAAWGLALGNVAAAGLLAAPVAEGAAEHATQVRGDFVLEALKPQLPSDAPRYYTWWCESS